jgi:hypothetical protein
VVDGVFGGSALSARDSGVEEQAAIKVSAQSSVIFLISVHSRSRGSLAADFDGAGALLHSYSAWFRYFPSFYRYNFLAPGHWRISGMISLGRALRSIPAIRRQGRYRGADLLRAAIQALLVSGSG